MAYSPVALPALSRTLSAARWAPYFDTNDSPPVAIFSPLAAFASQHHLPLVSRTV